MRYYYCSVAARNSDCAPVRIIHARDLPNSSNTLTSKGHTRLLSRFRLVSNTIRPACVAPHVIRVGALESLASLVANCQRVFLDLARYSNLEQTGPSSMGPNPYFSRISTQLRKNITEYSIAFLDKTGPYMDGFFCSFFLNSV